MAALEERAEPVRLDKWLWAARFFKTRSLAADAIDGGKVQLNGTRVKRGKPVKEGDQIRIRRGAYEFLITVRRLSEHRRSASDAATLYEESSESLAARQRLQEQHKLANVGFDPPKGRPTKRDRRTLDRLKRGKKKD